ncbi:TetR/AcrR family transcriptional regulator [Aromatoleum toluclasticum]|uniref:TetR/AcrR family transcriptional regulator n=1 Tax=Aromatoleum toluclasticum TaxID=92003 RepID=UPI00036413D8|nr:TetR/AcrR family transcriptional regulator [Aromatoleum toluclasticum]
MGKAAGRGAAHATSEGTKQRATPSQARARFTVETILEAASEILRVEGVDAVTTRKIAARAGVSVGAVYQYFPDKEAILIEISKRIMDEESEAASPELFRLHRKSLDEMLQALFRNTVRTETRLYSLGRDYYRRYARQMQFGRAQGLGRGSRTSEQLVANMEMLLKQHADVVGEPDTQLASFMLVRGMRTLLATLVEERPELLQSPSLVPMMVRIARAINDSRDGGEEGAGQGGR